MYPPPPGKSPREDQKNQTHKRIVDAAVDTLHEAGEENVTMMEVAARAGVTERTIYRHFRTRRVLLRWVWQRVLVSDASQRDRQTVDELIKGPRRDFPRWDETPEFARSSVYSPEALEARKRLSDVRQQAMLKSVRDAIPVLDEGTIRRRAAIAELLASSYTWEWLEQLWGLDGAEAGAAASEALEILLGHRPAG